MKPDFGRLELIPAIVQDGRSGRVRMLGYMNQQALDRTVESGELHLYSRSRQRLWHKGESSGHVHRVLSIRSDCDGDALLVAVDTDGPTCHEGTESCFTTAVLGSEVVEVGADAGPELLTELEALIATRLRDRPTGSYTATLAEGGAARIAQKVGEEAVEVVIAALGPDRQALRGEAADLLFHLLVLLGERGVGLGEVLSVLATRRGGGGR